MSRFPSRAATLLVLLVGVAACSESPANPRGAPARLAFAPHFTTQTASIYRSLATFGVTLDNVHVSVRGVGVGDAPGPVLADTTIAFPASADEVTIDIDLTIDTEEANVVAAIELRQGTTAFFGGSQSFVVSRGETATAPEPVALAYVGPGASAAFVNITPDSPTLAPSSGFQFAAQVFDRTEHPISDLPLSWSTSDATIASVTPTGLVTSTAKTGTVTLTVAGLNGISHQTTIRVQPVASLVVQSGASQSGIAGATLPTPFAVQAFDATQQPVIGAPITFAAAVNGAGSVSPASATTDANGSASTIVTLGSAAGSYVFTAAASGTQALARIAVTATAAATASLGILTGNQQADTVLATLGQPLAVRVADSFGNPVPGQTVDFRVTSGQAGLLAAGAARPGPDVQITTAADGTASVALAGGAVAGTVQVTASVPGTTIAAVTFSETLTPGVASRLVMLQQPSPTAQATLKLGRQPKVQVADLYGNAVALAGVTVLAEPVVDCSSGGVCEQVAAPRAKGLLLNRSPARSSASRTATLRRPMLTRAIPGSTSRLSVPTRIAATRSVSDTFPQGLGGTIQVVTDGNGVASFSDLSLDLPVIAGAWQIAFVDTTGTMASAISADIALSPGPTTSIVAQSGQDTLYFTAVSDTLHPAAVVIDPVGNGIPGVMVTWTVLNGNSKLDSTTTTTDANGVAFPGNWLLLPGAAGNFQILATPNASKIENAPLPIWAVQLLQ